LDLIGLNRLMDLTSGNPAVSIALIDGPVDFDHPDLAQENVHRMPGPTSGGCLRSGSAACQHGTFIAGILSARRHSPAPAICPNCTLLVRPIFSETDSPADGVPRATPDELAAALVDCIEAGVRLINLSSAVTTACSSRSERALTQALDFAAHRGALVVVAAGNQRMLGSTALTRHPWVIPVSACDGHGRPLHESNLGNSIGRRGLSAPGEGIASLGVDGSPIISSGTSVAAPFVTGALALVWSEFPDTKAGRLRAVLQQAHALRRPTPVPPLLNAWSLYQAVANSDWLN
jgi:subtilisin family serine protease